MTDSGAIAATTAAEPAEFHFFLNQNIFPLVLAILLQNSPRSGEFAIGNIGNPAPDGFRILLDFFLSRIYAAVVSTRIPQ